MEKILYVLTRNPASSPAELSDQLRGPVATALIERGAHGVQVNVTDDDVAAAAGLRMVGSGAAADAVVSVWVDSAVDHLRSPFDRAVADAATVSGLAAYLVTESVPIPNTRFPAEPGRRTDGMAQVVFLTRPGHLPVAEWLDLWLNGHTQVAIDTQDTFAYVQNVVARPLTEGAPPWAGIVEECFPAAAMTDPHVFFDAVGDDDRLRANQRAMVASTQRFLDYAAIDVIATSRYVVQPLG